MDHLPQLTDEQLEEVREFCVSNAAALLFTRLEIDILTAWMGAYETAQREKCWFEMRALKDLEIRLKNATSDKRLTQRSQNVRATNARTEPVRPV